MKNPSTRLSSLLLSGVLLSSASFLSASEAVTVDNFVNAETELTMQRYVDQGAFGKFFHMRQPTPIDKQDVIRMNRDTLYSMGVFDLTQPVTITAPDSGERFMSMMLVNGEHSIPAATYKAGDYTLTQEEVGSRYVFVAFRTFVDSTDPSDIKKAQQLQDKISVKQSDPGKFNIVDWDEKSLHTVRDAINVLANTKTDTSGYFGDKDKINPIQHLLGTAFGWGGNPKEDAIYVNATPTKNDGKTPHSLTVKEVPVDGFWSLTVYDGKGFMQKNEQDSYSFNSVSSEPNKDGSVTLNFGGDPKSTNYLPITKDWNYIVRLYQPKKEILDGTWEFPKAEPTK